MKIFQWLAELRYRDNLLYRIGLIHIILFFLLFVPFLLDSREVLGINTWIKPMKFALSIGIYAWTFGWIMFDLENHKKLIKILSWGIAITMLTEMFVILYQAGRGVQSHFNFSTQFDGLLFGIMGIMILVNTVIIFIVFGLYLFPKPKMDPVYLLSLRAGFVIFILANIVGGMMIGNEAHSIGVEDGGAGLPFVNWSTEGGDLRVAHFLGLHAIQIIPLTAYFLKSREGINEKSRQMIVGIVILLYAILFSSVFIQAKNGNPLIG